jgi:hypothetical protein
LYGGCKALWGRGGAFPQAVLSIFRGCNVIGANHLMGMSRYGEWSVMEEAVERGILRKEELQG